MGVGNQPEGWEEVKQGNKPGPNAYDYLKLPTNQQLHQQTTSATNMAYRPTERQIRANKRASALRTKNIGNWWNQYLQEVSGQQAATQAAYAAANQQTQGLIGAAGQVDSANTARLNSEAAQSAALRGQDASLANQAATQTSNAALAQRNTALGTMGAAMAARGANQFSYLADKSRVGKGQRASSMEAEAKRGAGMLADLANLRKERGDYATKYLGEKQKEARDYLLQRQAFNLDKKNANLDQLNEEANREIDWYNAKTGRQNSQSGGGGAGGRTPSQAREDRKDYKNAYTTAEALYQSAKSPPQSNKEWAAWIALVAKETGVDAQIVKKAVQKFRQTIKQKNKGANVAGVNVPW